MKIEDFNPNQARVVRKFLLAVAIEDWIDVAIASDDMLYFNIEVDLSDRIEPHRDFFIKNFLIDIKHERSRRIRAILAVLRNLNVAWPEMSIIERASFDMDDNI